MSGLASNPELIAEVNKVLGGLQESGKLAEFGQATGLTYLPPREPAVLGDAFQKILRSGAQ